ncbi:MAG: hypothetical protein SGBAC_012119 [Bacillariaceae sp.]
MDTYMDTYIDTYMDTYMDTYIDTYMDTYMDTLASKDAKLGSDQGWYNVATVTGEQFGAAVLGFLTYRVLFYIEQVKDAFAEEEGNEVGALLPGSADVAMESFLSAKVKEIVRKIEIDGWEKSLNGLKDAAEYCFKY